MNLWHSTGPQLNRPEKIVFILAALSNTVNAALMPQKSGLAYTPLFIML